MARPIWNGKIDVMKIDKAHLYKGKSGTYLDFAVWESTNEKHGNSHFLTQDVSKEAREAGAKGAIIGNLKPVAGGGGGAAAEKDEKDNENLPF